MMSSKKQRTRDKILDAAQRLLVKRGYYGVGLEEIAQEAGVSRQAIYLHFKSKAELLVAMAQHGDEMVGIPEIHQSVREASNGQEAIDQGVAAYAKIQPRIYDIASVIYAARRAHPVAEAVWQNRMAFRREEIREGIERLNAEGLIAEGWTVGEATDFVWAILSLHTYEYLVVERGWSIEQFVRRLRMMLHRTIVKGPDAITQ